MNCCKLEQVGTKEHGTMIKRIQVLEDGRIPAKRARNWKIGRTNRRITRQEHRRLWNELVTGGFTKQKKGCGTSPERRCCRTEVQCPKKKETL